MILVNNRDAKEEISESVIKYKLITFRYRSRSLPLEESWCERIKNTIVNIKEKIYIPITIFLNKERNLLFCFKINWYIPKQVKPKRDKILVSVKYKTKVLIRKVKTVLIINKRSNANLLASSFIATCKKKR